MTTQDIGIYLMTWLISSLLIWLMGWELDVKTKIIVPIVIVVFEMLLRISIFLMIGE